MKVVILHDSVPESARADEADALVQAQAVRAALEALGHEWLMLGLTLDLEAARMALRRLAPDLVFNLCESLGGFARLIDVPCDLLEALRIPYTGAPAAAQMLTSNKLAAKSMLRLSGIPTPVWFTKDARDSGESFTPGRYIFKSVWEHASIGLDESSVAMIKSRDDLLRVLTLRLPQLGGEGFAEEFIDGREFNLALLAAEGNATPQILPPCEIVFDNFPLNKAKVVNYNAKWNEDSFEYAHTPRQYEFPPQDHALIDAMKSIAVQCWQVFGLRGYARVDFRVDEAGRPWVLEVNTNPCLSPDAGYAAALEQAGLPFTQAVQRIVNDAPAPADPDVQPSRSETARESTNRQPEHVRTKAG